MVNVTSLVMSERLLCLVEVLVECSHRWIFLEHIVDHRVDFVGKEHPQLLADDLNAQGVDCANNRPVLAVERLQPRVDVVQELPGDNPVERDHEDVVAINTEPIGMQDALDASHEAERFAASRPGDAPDGVRV